VDSLCGGAVQSGCQEREVAGFMCKVVHRDLTVPDWSVEGGTPVQIVRFPESDVMGACIVNESANP